MAKRPRPVKFPKLRKESTDHIAEIFRLYKDQGRVPECNDFVLKGTILIHLYPRQDRKDFYQDAFASAAYIFEVASRKMWKSGRLHDAVKVETNGPMAVRVFKDGSTLIRVRAGRQTTGRHRLRMGQELEVEEYV